MSRDEVAAANVLEYFGSRFPTSFQHAAGELGIDTNNQMDAVATYAMWQDANLSTAQTKVIAQHLRHHFGKSVVTNDMKIKRELAVSSRIVVPECGTYRNGNERVEWMVRDPVSLVLAYLDTLVNRQSTRCLYHSIDVLVSLDHGKGASRCYLEVIVRIKGEDGVFTEQNRRGFQCAEAICKKDSYLILDGTYMPSVNAGLEAIKSSGGVVIWDRGMNHVGEDCDGVLKERYYSALQGKEQDNETDTVLYPNTTTQLLSVGDFAQHVTNCGRYNYDRDWCLFCDLSKAEWQPENHPNGMIWNNQRLESHLERTKDSTNANTVRGVRKKHILPSIDISDVTLPVLHLQLGLINKGYNALITAIQAGMETYSDPYLFYENKLNECVTAEKVVTLLRDAFLKNSADAKMAIIQAEVGAKVIVNENPGIIISKSSIKHLVKKREAELKEAKRQATVNFKAAKNAFDKESAKPENSKATGQPLRDAIEELLKREFGLDKGVYFGGDFQGTEVRRLMKDRHAIFTSIRELLETHRDRMIVSAEKVWEILDAYERLFGHLDAVFSICRIKRYHTTTNDISVLRRQVKQAVSVWRALGLSITPKMHCVEDHLCDIVAHFEGVGDIGEDEGERAHQTGHKNDCRNKALRDHAKRALSNV
jgi:hypothetical protein